MLQKSKVANFPADSYGAELRMYGIFDRVCLDPGLIRLTVQLKYSYV